MRGLVRQWAVYVGITVHCLVRRRQFETTGEKFGGNRGIQARAEIAEQTQTDRDSAWSEAAQEVFSDTLTSAGLEILVDHYSAGDVVARSGDNGG